MTKKPDLREDIKKVLQLIGKNRIRFLFYSLGVGITNTLVGIFISFATKNMVDYFTLESGNHIQLAVLSIISAVVSGGVFFPVFYYLINMMKAKIINQVRLDLFSHLQKMPARYFELHHSGDTLARVNKDLNALEIALDTMVNFLARIISMCLIIPYIIALDYRLGVISFILGLIAMVFNIKFRLPMREKSKEIHKYNATMTEQMTDNVTGFNVIKTYNLSDRYFEKYKEKVDEVVKAELKLSLTNGFLYSTNSLIGWFGRGGLAVIGCLFVIKGTMTAGTLMGGIFTASNLSYSLIDMGEMLATVQKSFAGSDRVYELLNEPVEPLQYETKGTGCESGIAITNGVFS
ncbi:MAG: ABC transporter ATP-binding protein [Clostridia bacterium]|nr:ABC transporter ATP-binding protein [Clostridia bacterium]